MRPGKDIVLNLLTLNELVNNPVQIFVCVDDVRSQHHLIILVVEWDELIESLVATASSHHADVSFHVTVQPVGAN